VTRNGATATTVRGVDPQPAPFGPADRRFVADAEAHRRDLPRFCPRCGAALTGPNGADSGQAGIAVEYWAAEDRIYYCWCARCRWAGEIITSGDGVVGHEPEH
jgi:hypothetical protein